MPRSLTVLSALLERELGYQGWWPVLGRSGSPGYNGAGYRLSPAVGRQLSDDERFEIAVGAVLTQNTTWDNASIALANLLDSGFSTAAGILRAGQEELAGVIRSSGYHNQKAKKLRLLSGEWEGVLERRLDGEAMRAFLLGVWGIGPETADSILLYAFGHAYFVVDAYARRIFSRVGLIGGRETYDVIQQSVHDALGRSTGDLAELHALLVVLGKASCKTRPHCDECPVRSVCKTGSGGDDSAGDQLGGSPES